MKLIYSLTLIVAALLVTFLVAWSGLFNVSAKEKHWSITTNLLEFVRERSIEVRADDIEVPKNLSDTDMISKGAKNFDAMCAQCHLSPITQPTELSIGLYPQPPVFYKAKHGDHNSQNTFWVIKNGLKLTGMPAWGDFHTDEQMWEMVAFLKTIKGMPADEYRQLVGEGGHAHKPGAGHGDSPMDGNEKSADHNNDDGGTHHESKVSDGHHDDKDASDLGGSHSTGEEHKH